MKIKKVEIVIEEDFPDPSDEELGLIISPAEETESKAGCMPDKNKNQKPSSSSVLLHLFLGFFLMGTREAQQRIEKKKNLVEKTYTFNQPLEYEESQENEFRYAVIGLLLKTPAAISRSTSKFNQTAVKILNTSNNFLRPVTNSRLVRPLTRTIDKFVNKGESIVNDWIDTGRRGEKYSQQLVQETMDEVVSDVFDSLAERDEISELVQQQSYGIAQEVSDALQDRASAADTILERIVFKILPGSKVDTTPTLDLPLPEDD